VCDCYLMLFDKKSQSDPESLIILSYSSLKWTLSKSNLSHFKLIQNFFNIQMFQTFPDLHGGLKDSKIFIC